jgi:predicted small lipoprotein YifL
MRLRTFVLTTLLALAVAGCGVRGNLEPPSAADAPEGAPVDEATPVDDRPFILDGLLL